MKVQDSASGRFGMSRRVFFAGIATVGAVLLGSCTIDGPSLVDNNAAIGTDPQVAITASVEDGDEAFNPSAPVTVSVENGTLTQVSLINPEGLPVLGEMTPEKTSWASKEPLGYSRTYSLTASATDGDGLVTNFSRTFSALTPQVMTAAYMLTGTGATFGVGQPVAVVFDEPIGDRQAAQDAITVDVNPPVEGAFFWLSNQEVRWRPEQFWAPGTHVEVAVDIYGKDLGNGMYGQEDARSSFDIGDEVIATVDDAAKQIVISRNGEVVNSMPTSMGKGSDPTPNGTYIIGDRQAAMVMDSSTYGVPIESPEGYRTPVKYATRMSYSGIFVHAAPWSIWAQGKSNVSHGCLNVSTPNAAWFFNNTKRGDVVQVTGTIADTLSGYDGLGDWNIPWETWKAGNVDDGPAVADMP